LKAHREARHGMRPLIGVSPFELPSDNAYPVLDWWGRHRALVKRALLVAALPPSACPHHGRPRGDPRQRLWPARGPAAAVPWTRSRFASCPRAASACKGMFPPSWRSFVGFGFARRGSKRCPGVVAHVGAQAVGAPLPLVAYWLAANLENRFCCSELSGGQLKRVCLRAVLYLCLVRSRSFWCSVMRLSARLGLHLPPRHCFYWAVFASWSFRRHG